MYRRRLKYRSKLTCLRAPVAGSTFPWATKHHVICNLDSSGVIVSHLQGAGATFGVEPGVAIAWVRAAGILAGSRTVHLRIVLQHSV